jgi:hypothetical protein
MAKYLYVESAVLLIRKGRETRVLKKRGLARLLATFFVTLSLCVMVVSPAVAYLGTPINSGWAGMPYGTMPTIDGTVDHLVEWSKYHCTTIRNFTLEMRSRIDGSLDRTLDGRFYVKNNYTFIFAAIEIFNDDYEAQDFANNWNGLALLFEDDHDGVLSAGDNGEGVTSWSGSPFFSKNDLYYTGSYWDADLNAGQTNDGAIAWSHTNPTQGQIGNWTFEMMIPLAGTDGDAYDLDITTLPETVGFKIWFQEPSKGLDGVYPDDPTINKNIEEISNAATYGELVLHPLYALTITTTTGGITPGPGEFLLCYGKHVWVTATPDVCYEFDHWELDSVDVGSANPIYLMMDQNHTLHAVFKLIYYTLTITTTTGGTTDPAPGTYSHPCSSVIDVLAIPDTGYEFDHWQLDSVDVGSVNPISVTMDQNHTLHAVFMALPPPECVGGEVTLIKVNSPPPTPTHMHTWIALGSALVLTASFVYVGRRKRKRT